MIKELVLKERVIGVVGDVKDVTGTATLYDADDGTTVIGTIAIAASPNYRLITIP